MPLHAEHAPLCVRRHRRAPLLPPAEAYTNQYAEAANAALSAEGLDTTGDGFAPIEVTLNEGGN